MARMPKYEYCDHVEQSHKNLYNVTIQLGDNRVLLLCPQCGMALEAAILAEFCRRVLKEALHGTPLQLIMED